MHIITICRLAAAFLTRVPGLHPPDATPVDFAWAHAVFPLIGALIGAGIAGAQLAGLAFGLPPIAAAGLALAMGMLLTGALHEDGLADMVDGFGGGRDRAAKLTIMRDSRLGTYGAVSLILVTIIKVGALTSLSGGALLVAVTLAGAASRSAASIVAGILPPARTDGLSATAGRPDRRAVAFSIVVSAAATALLVPDRAIVAGLAIAGLLVALIVLAHRQIGGQTGDVLGATQQLAETTMLLVLCAHQSS